MRYRHFHRRDVAISIFILGDDVEAIDSAKEMFPTFFAGKTSNFGMVGISAFFPADKIEKLEKFPCFVAKSGDNVRTWF